MPRSALPDGAFHVISRGVNGCAIFRDDDDRRFFLAGLRACANRFRWTVDALCLMNTHFHLVLRSTQPELSRGMQRLLGRYAQAFNHKHMRFGHLFADRFTARSIDEEEYLAAACAYVMANPVRAGLAREVGEWPWAHTRYRDASAAPQRPGLRATYQPTSIS